MQQQQLEAWGVSLNEPPELSASNRLELPKLSSPEGGLTAEHGPYGTNRKELLGATALASGQFDALPVQ